MTNDNNSVEVPVTWSVKYLSKSGYECKVTLRSKDHIEVLDQAEDVLNHIDQTGATPTYNTRTCDPERRPIYEVRETSQPGQHQDFLKVTIYG